MTFPGRRLESKQKRGAVNFAEEMAKVERIVEPAGRFDANGTTLAKEREREMETDRLCLSHYQDSFVFAYLSKPHITCRVTWHV